MKNDDLKTVELCIMGKSFPVKSKRYGRIDEIALKEPQGRAKQIVSTTMDKKNPYFDESYGEKRPSDGEYESFRFE